MDERRDVVAAFINPRVPNVGCQTVALPLAVGQRQRVFGTFGTRSFFLPSAVPVWDVSLGFFAVLVICLFRVVGTGHLLTISVALSRFRVSQRGRGKSIRPA
jgi:hypothetical protein